MSMQRRCPGPLTRGVVWPPLSNRPSLWAGGVTIAIFLMMAWLGLYQFAQMIQLW